jgi:hypothetical protein
VYDNNNNNGKLCTLTDWVCISSGWGFNLLSKPQNLQFFEHRPRFNGLPSSCLGPRRGWPKLLIVFSVDLTELDHPHRLASYDLISYCISYHHGLHLQRRGFIRRNVFIAQASYTSGSYRRSLLDEIHFRIGLAESPVAGSSVHLHISQGSGGIVDLLYLGP